MLITGIMTTSVQLFHIENTRHNAQTYACALSNFVDFGCDQRDQTTAPGSIILLSRSHQNTKRFKQDTERRYHRTSNQKQKSNQNELKRKERKIKRKDKKKEGEKMKIKIGKRGEDAE